MAFCNECMTGMHRDDVRNHVCKEEDKQEKGKEKKVKTEDVI